MAYRTVEESSLTGIADAIREAGGTGESLLFPDDFLTAISNMGGTGGTLTVTAPAGSTVTATKDGKTLTRVAEADGVVVFRGLETGTWNLTITDGEQTASKPVNIVADYATSITFFMATIHITYPAGSTCTVTDGVTTLTAPDTSGTWDCVVPNAGEWTVALDSGFSEVVSATESGGTYTVDKWYLFKDGDQHTDLTGGWTAGKNTNGTLHYFDVTDQIRVTTDTISVSSYGWFVTKKMINLSGFKNLHYHFTRRYSPTQNAGFKLGVGSDVLHVPNYKVLVTNNGAVNSYDLTYNVDISSGVTGSVRCDISEYQNTTTVNVDKIYVRAA